MARVARMATSEVVAKLTIRRGSTLKFQQDGSCEALDGTTCTIHSGRPLACRLYPLGLERHHGAENYVHLEPASGSLGMYGRDGTVRDFVAAQGADRYVEMNRCYARLLNIFRHRIAQLCDFDIVEPREFWRVAIREALCESNFDFNPLIEVLFDPDSLCHFAGSETNFVEHHISEIEQRIRDQQDARIVASAGVFLAVSLGYSPSDVMVGQQPVPSSD